jgi:pimeloyl-ACP methyl ester carboxylesterase
VYGHEVDTLAVRNGDVNLHVLLDGDGPTILLLHGWPDTSALWDEVRPLLVDAGFRVAVPDLRGCGRSDKPSDVEDYRMHHLVGDVVSIVGALGDGKVILAGHDWGAALAWTVATFRADLVERLVVLSVGHPSAFYGAGISQQIKSWYMLLFQFEGVGEAFLRKNDHEAIRRWTGHPRPDAVIEELERDGQMRAHLLWYRANVAPDAFVRPAPVLPLVEMPVLGIWSSGDFALTEHQMITSENYCANEFRYVRLEGAGHWIPLEAVARLSREIVEFCSSRDILP